MKEAAMKAYKAVMEADEAGAEAWVKTAAKAGVEAAEAAPVKSAAEPAAMKAAAVNYNGRSRHR